MVKNKGVAVNPVVTQPKPMQNLENDVVQDEDKRDAFVHRFHHRVSTTPVKNNFVALIEATTEELYYEVDQIGGKDTNGEMQGLEALESHGYDLGLEHHRN